MSTDTKARWEPRTTVSAPIRLAWEDTSGIRRMANGTACDVSRTGLKVSVLDRLEPGTYVSFECTKLGLQGTASVRYSKRAGLRHVAGLEFIGGLKWKQPVA